MELLDAIDIPDGLSTHRIELLFGDLLELAPDERVDTLVVSAFPDDYAPTPGSLIGALEGEGVSLTELAASKRRDLRRVFSCWLSEPISDADRIGFGQVLCFEPLVRGSPPEVVDDIFRALNAVLLGAGEDSTVAMPLVASGDQGWPPESMIEPLLEAAAHWLSFGLPISCLKIVERSNEKARLVAQHFAAFRSRRRRLVDGEASGPQTSREGHQISKAAQEPYDVFVSYSHRNRVEVDTFVEHLRETRPGVRLFVDRLELGIGVEWLTRIARALDRSKKVVTIFSPDYFESKPCQDELNTAILLDNRVEQQVLFPIYLYSAEVPTLYLAKAQYLDCREGDRARLASAAGQIASLLGPR